MEALQQQATAKMDDLQAARPLGPVVQCTSACHLPVLKGLQELTSKTHWAKTSTKYT